MASSSLLIDGDFSQATEVGAPRYSYPFRQYGDPVSAFFEQDCWQIQATYAAQKLGIQHPTKPGFYLVEESDPTPIIGNLLQFTRVWSMIPQEQTVPSSLFITKPDIPGTFPQVFGDYVVFRPVSSVASYDAYTPQAVTADGGPNSSAATGGTYTITYAGQTTGAIAYNASAGTVQTALNALGKITALGGVTVTGSVSAGFSVVFANPSLLTVNTASLTVSGGSISSSPFGGNANRNFFQVPQIQASGSAFTITGGTFTITILGQTTAAIAYNATAATVAAALNALTNFAAYGFTASVDTGTNSTIYPGSYFLYFTISIKAATLSATSTLLPPAISISVAGDGYGTDQRQTVTFPAGTGSRTMTVPAHGFTTNDTLFVKIGDNYYDGIAPGGFTLPDSDTVLITQAGGQLTDTGLAAQCGKRTISGYSPTATQTRVKYVTDFYLPGVSAGITTIDDIPLPTYQGDPASLLTAIFAGTSTINYQVGALEIWKGPIIQRKITTLNAAKL